MALGVVALLGGLGWELARREGVGTHPEPPREGETHVPAGSGAVPRRELLATRLAQGAPSFGDDACLEDTDTGAAQRPSLASVVDVALEELYGRARLVLAERSADPELRDGLREMLVSEGDAEVGANLLARAPGRIDAGFDHAAVAMIAAGARALASDDDVQALAWARRAVDAAPEIAVTHAFLALVADQGGDPNEAMAALRRAFALEPAEPALGLTLGLRLLNEPDLTEAAAALGTYLTSAPDDAAIARIGQRVDIRMELQHDFVRQVSGGITLLYPARLGGQAAAHVLEVIAAALEETAALTGSERRGELTVVVYEDRSDMLATTCASGWTGAIFDGTLRLHMEALRSRSRGDATVRHESVHAQLRVAAPNAPVWLHEGLAEHLAGGSPERHRAGLLRLAESGTWIPFDSMEGNFLVIGDADAAELAYDQSLVMVEALMERGGDRVIARAVALLRDGGEASGIFALVDPALTGRDVVERAARQVGAR